MASGQKKTRLPSEELKYFLAIPWCSTHLQSENIVFRHPPARYVLKPSGEGELWSVTLNTRDTFPSMLCFYHEPSDPKARINEVRAFITVDRGVQGYPNVVHGGIVATILDEITGYLPQINRKRGVAPRDYYMTGYLNTTFLKPVRTPSTMLVTARIIKIEGRKLLIEGRIEDENGDVLAKAETLFIALKTQL